MGLIQLFLFTLISGVYPQTPKEIRIKAGEIVALYCERPDHGEKTLWKSNNNLDIYMYSNMSAAEQRQIGVVVHKNSLVILSASADHQGNYTCSFGNASRQYWYRLTVYTQSREHKETIYITKPCYTLESCQLGCPAVNIPPRTFANNSTTWPEVPDNGFFSSVAEKDSGIYTCIRSYPYQGQIYNVTFRVKLEVKPNESQKTTKIIKPHETVFPVKLGSQKVIECEASPCNGSLYWVWNYHSENGFVDPNQNVRVFSNETKCDSKSKDLKMTASLVFRQVLKEDLAKNYTCKLETDDQPSSFITITLTEEARPSYISLAVCIVVFIVVSVVTLFIHVKFKVDVILFLRDTLGCHSNTSDGKSYDAFLMCYESDTEGGLNAHDRKMLESVLEERFGYSLCLHDRDILPGNAVSQAVLDCIEQSRAVVLVPTSPDPGLGSGLLSAIHEALVERQTRLIFINTDTYEVSRSGSIPEALQLLSEAGNHVTWKGMSSMPPSSSFWKQLRYYLPAPQRAQKMQLLPQTIQVVNSK